MSEEKQVRVTGTDIASLGEKLEQFQQGLPENEQNVMAWLIQRASEAPADDEVEGYLSQFAAQSAQVARVNPTYSALGAAQLGRLNPGQLAGVSIVVGVMF